MEPSLPDLEQRRARLYEELASADDLRRGSITATYPLYGAAPLVVCNRLRLVSIVVTGTVLSTRFRGGGTLWASPVG